MISFNEMHSNKYASFYHFFLKVLNKVGEEIKNFDDLDETTVNEGYKATMFPPTDEENRDTNLERW